MKTIESGAICEACGTWNAIQYDVAQGPHVGANDRETESCYNCSARIAKADCVAIWVGPSHDEIAKQRGANLD